MCCLTHPLRRGLDHVRRCYNDKTLQNGELMRIALIAPERGTSLHRAHALKRLCHDVWQIDPWSWLKDSKWVNRWRFHAGAIGIGPLIKKRIIADVQACNPQLILVDQGEFLGPSILRLLRQFSVPIVDYLIDDPFGGRDGLRFFNFRRAIPYFDLLVVVREQNVGEAYSRGAQHVLKVHRSADDVAHARRHLTVAERGRYASEVAFIGTWMPGRGSFMAELVQRGTPLSIWGDRWSKAPEWPLLEPYWRGPGLNDDEAYAAAIQSAKICLGLLSKGNRDLHTTRSMEIPAIGGLLCAERTSEHLDLYDEGREAVFWSDAQECATACRTLLHDEMLRQEIVSQGHNRALRNGHYNEQVMSRILDEAMTIPLRR